MHKNFEINLTIGFLLNNFLSGGLLRFGGEKLPVIFCSQSFQAEGMDLSTYFFSFIPT